MSPPPYGHGSYIPPNYFYPDESYLVNPAVTRLTSTATQSYICPDLLRLSQIGAADGWRGKAVRIFFWILKKVTGV